ARAGGAPCVAARRGAGGAPSHADELCRRGAADCPARSLCRGRGRRRRGGIGMLSGGRCLRPRVHAGLSRGPRGLAPDLHERRVMTACWARLILIAVFLLAPLGALAQAPQPAPTQPLLGAAELDKMLAPIAMYPDPLLSEVLIASTYPREVVQADRWAKANTKLKGDALSTALAKQNWDDSVKSLVQVPTVLTMMADQLDWTQKLGDAMLAQQPDVMDSVQRLRARAQANGKLATTKEQTVTVKTEDQKQ